MSHPPFPSSDDLRHFVSQATPEQLMTALPEFSMQELAESFAWLQSDGVHLPEEKRVSLFEFIESPKGVETLGKNLSARLLMHVLNFLIPHPQFHNRLSYLLIGLEPQIFSAALNFFQPAHLAMFKEEGMFEPLQYHLTQFVHEGESLHRQIALELEQFEGTLLSMKNQELTAESLEALIAQIDAFRSRLLDFLERISVALSIAWNTDRIDLIERLSNINEALQHQLALFIGHPSSGNFSATGLYARVEETFSEVFDSSLKDEDASIEGLTRLSIWHLRDYWELGLLPQVHRLQELNLDPSNLQEGQRTAYHQQLYSEVQKQLEKLKIGTVRDLKREYVFSKALLKAYIDRNRN